MAGGSRRRAVHSWAQLAAVTLLGPFLEVLRSVVRHADAVAVVVVAPARALAGVGRAAVGRAAVGRGRGRRRADHGARARADRRAGQRAAGASVRDRGADQRARPGAERPADQGVLLAAGSRRLRPKRRRRAPATEPTSFSWQRSPVRLVQTLSCGPRGSRRAPRRAGQPPASPAHSHNPIKLQ